MKSLYIFCLIVLAATLSSCKDFLTVEPKSNYDSENLFQTVKQAQMTVYGAYVLMAHPMYGRKVVTMCTTDTDEMRTQGGWEAVGRRNFSRYSSTPASIDTELASLWASWYRCIERCNICIERIPQMELWETGTDGEKAELRSMYGEMLALRAMCYFDVIKHWGDVPFSTKPTVSGDKMYIDRTSRDVIYDYIISDLAVAADMTRWRKAEGVAIQARFTKGAVKALRARIALHAAGYSLRWDLRSGGNMGMRQRDDALRVRELYQIARDECRDIIQDPAANHRLDPNFIEIWKRVCTQRFDTEYGESMFEIGMYSPEFGSTGNGSIGNKIGATSNKESRYGNGSSEVRLTPIYSLSFDNLDTRRAVTVCDLEAVLVKNSDGVVINNGAGAVVNRLWEYNPGKWRAWWYNYGGGYMNEYTNINWIMIRYSDVLLMFAEAENYLMGGPTSEGVDALKQVRRRAFKGNETVVDGENYMSMSESQFLDALVTERWWEFGGEAIRKYDLIRWNKLEERLNAAKAFNTWLAGLSNTDTNIYRYVHYKPLDDLAKDEMSMQRIYSTSNTPPDGWKSTGYRNAIASNADIMTTFARDFKANKTELYPIPQSVRDDNPRISQHPSYGN